MKSTSLLFLFIFLILRLHAQNIDNPSFDSAHIGGINRVFSWITSDAWNVVSGDTVLPMAPLSHFISTGLEYNETLNSVQIEYSNSFDILFDIKIFSDTARIHKDGSPFRGFIVNGNHFYTDSSGYIDLKKGGAPFPYRPYLFRGHYKFEDQSPSLNNYPTALVLLKKYNSINQTSDTIGYAEIRNPLFTTSTWRLFEMPINYLSNETPDSIVVAFLSPGLRYLSTFWLDSLEFDYSFPSIINDKENFHNSFLLFPIPARENISIEFEKVFTGNGIISIKNLSDQIILNQNIFISNGKVKIDLPETISGIYLIDIITENRTYHKIFSVE